MLKKIYNSIKNNEASFYIVKNDEIIYSDSGIGVKPIMKVINECPSLIEDAVVIDKVIGKAAAMLLIKYKACAVHGILMSNTAIRMFEKHNVPYYFEDLVEAIQNRTNTGLCPLEDSVKDTNDIEQGFLNIKDRIAELMKN